MKLLRALPLVLLFVALLPSCSPPKEADYSKLGYAGEVFTDPETGKPFTGIARQKYPDGKVQGEYPFKNGRFHGTVKEWHPNGAPSATTQFLGGERTGKNIEWTASGQVFRERVYDHDHIVSEKNYPDAK